MKKVIGYLLVVLTSVASAQNLNVARHRNLDVPTNIVSINSKSYFGEMIGTCCQDSLNIVGVSNSLQTFFKTKLVFFGSSWNTPKKIITTRDKGVLLFGRLNAACDIMTFKDFIAKTDTLGTVAFQTTLSPQSFSINNLLCDITECNDSSFIAIQKSGSSLAHFSKAGLFNGFTNTTFGGMNAIATLTSGNLIINGRIGGVLKNVETTLNNVIVNQQNTSNILTKIVQSPLGDIYGLDSTGVLIQHNASLTALNNSTVGLGANAKIRDFVIKNDSIYCAGTTSPSNTAFYSVLNSTLGVLYVSQSSYKNVYPNGITVNNKNKVNIVTYGTSTKNIPMSFSSIYQMAKSGAFQSKYDIGVIGFSAITSTNYNGGAQPVIKFDLNVTVQNFGLDTVRSFYLNHFSIATFCAYVFHKYYSVMIPPNGVISVPTGTFYTRDLSVASGVTPNIIYKNELCINTSVPNFENDIEINNDAFCDSVEVAPVGIYENIISKNNFKIFPNPFGNFLSIESDLVIEKIIIFNSLGEKLFEEIVKQKSFKLNDWKLNSGIYFVRIETENGSVVRKIVRE